MNIQTAIDLYAGGPGSGCHGPNCGRPRKNFDEGDHVHTIDKGTGVHVIHWGREEFPAGTKGRIVKVMDSIPNQPDRVVVSVSKKDSPTAPKGFVRHYIMEQDNLVVHKAAGKPFDPGKIRTPNVPESKVLSRSKSEDGVKYTIVKPSQDDRVGTRGATNFSNREHSLKGQFSEPERVGQFLTKQDYQEGKNAVQSWVYEAKRPDGSGAVVWLMKDKQPGQPQSIVIREENYTQDKAKYGTPRIFEYKNQAQAFSVMNNRYGVKMTMKDWMSRK